MSLIPHPSGSALAHVAAAGVALAGLLVPSASHAVTAESISGGSCPLRVATTNVNWGLPAAKVDQDLDDLSPHADLVMAQEAKNVTVDRLLGDGWHTHQDLSRDDKRGTAVSWRAGMHELRDGYALGVRPGPAAMLTRWISWTDVPVGGRTVRFASTHRPPPRYDYLWRAFDRNLGDFVRSSPHPVLVGLDSNTFTHARLERRTGLHWHGVGRDGFLTDLRLEDVHALPRGYSDHHPVVADLPGLAGRTAC